MNKKELKSFINISFPFGDSEIYLGLIDSGFKEDHINKKDFFNRVMESEKLQKIFMAVLQVKKEIK